MCNQCVVDTKKLCDEVFRPECPVPLSFTARLICPQRMSLAFLRFWLGARSNLLPRFCRGGYHPPARYNPRQQNTLGESAPRPTWYHSTKHAIVPRGGRLIASPTLGCTFFGVQSNFCYASVGEDIILPRGKTPNDGKCWANSYPCPTFFHSTEHSVIQPGGRILSSPTMDCMFLGVHSVSPCHDSAILGNVSIINRGST